MAETRSFTLPDDQQDAEAFLTFTAANRNTRWSLTAVDLGSAATVFTGEEPDETPAAPDEPEPAPAPVEDPPAAPSFPADAPVAPSEPPAPVVAAEPPAEPVSEPDVDEAAFAGDADAPHSQPAE